MNIMTGLTHMFHMSRVQVSSLLLFHIYILASNDARVSWHRHSEPSRRTYQPWASHHHNFHLIPTLFSFLSLPSYFT